VARWKGSEGSTRRCTGPEEPRTLPDSSARAMGRPSSSSPPSAPSARWSAGPPSRAPAPAGPWPGLWGGPAPG
jgi:hypothetical protein